MANKPAKYRNVKTVVDGIKFDSKREAARWQHLALLAKAGKIKNLTRQITFELVPAVVLDGKKQRPVKYIADFAYEDEHGATVVEDSKGFKTPDYVIKRKMMRHVFDIEVKEV